MAGRDEDHVAGRGGQHLAGHAQRTHAGGQLPGGSAMGQAATLAFVQAAPHEMLQFDAVDIPGQPGRKFLGCVAHLGALRRGWVKVADGRGAARR
jgi:hypothetical protein